MAIEVLLWITVWGLIGSLVAKERSGEVGGGFLMGAILGPIGVVIAYMYRGTNTASEKKLATRGLARCPHCDELVRLEAKVCRHCGRDI